ncbi:MAG: type secretion system minor pseudopilin GspK [Pseudomonadota bacterium]|jgi:general secretion pathway protein K
MKEKGVALITALLIVALVVIIATSLLEKQHIIMQRTANHLQQEQAYLYALGAESWATKILMRDRQQNKVDHLSEMWAKQLPPAFISGGQLNGRLTDEQGKFNINNLLDHENKPSPENIQRFERLLKKLELPVNIAMQALDWIDRDTNVQMGGAEDNEYSLQNPPYRTANLRFQSIEELRLLLGMKEAYFKVLSPHITVLPTSTPINLNTTSVEILMSMVENLPQISATTLLEKARQGMYKTVEDFLKESLLNNLKVDMKGLSVSSDYFRLETTVIIGENMIKIDSLLQRDEQQCRVLMRHLRGE